jgi:hypothetical protein
MAGGARIWPVVGALAAVTSALVAILTFLSHQDHPATAATPTTGPIVTASASAVPGPGTSPTTALPGSASPAPAAVPTTSAPQTAAATPTTAPAEPQQQPAADSAKLLGAPDWNSYCQSVGEGSAHLVQNNAYGWYCTSSGNGIDANTVCAYTYGTDTTQVTNRVADFNNPATWQCWHATRELGPLDFTAYCQSTGHTGAHLVSADHAYGWFCNLQRRLRRHRLPGRLPEPLRRNPTRQPLPGFLRPELLAVLGGMTRLAPPAWTEHPRRRLAAQRSPNSPLFTAETNADHASTRKLSAGPAGSLESRTGWTAAEPKPSSPRSAATTRSAATPASSSAAPTPPSPATWPPGSAPVPDHVTDIAFPPFRRCGNQERCSFWRTAVASFDGMPLTTNCWATYLDTSAAVYVSGLPGGGCPPGTALVGSSLSRGLGGWWR